MINQYFDNLHIATRTGSMQRKNAIEYRIDRLAMIEGILDKTNVSSSSCGVQTEAGDWRVWVSYVSLFVDGPTLGGDIVLCLCFVIGHPQWNRHGCKNQP